MEKAWLTTKHLAIGLTVLVGLSACTTVSYYSQSVIGHSRLMLTKQPIDEAIASNDGEIKRQLKLAIKMRRFAVERLALPDNKSYLSYVPLKREYPVWSVVAAAEFSLKPQRWCYPVIGCAAYRGYFSKADAQKYAEGLQKKNLETQVGGATAYSTLGWFNDPLIPPMMRNGDASLAEVMFHELAHQQLYIKGNSAFNEAFATVVGEHGALLWLKENDPDKERRYREIMQVRNDFSGLIKVTKERLNNVYESPSSDEQKRQLKKEVFDQLRSDYEALKVEKWNGKTYYGNWIKKPLNNARLASFATYRDLVPAFENLHEQCGRDYAKFYAVVSLQKGKGKDSVVANQCE